MTPKDPQLTGLDLCWEAKGLSKTPANLREIYQQAEDLLKTQIDHIRLHTEFSQNLRM